MSEVRLKKNPFDLRHGYTHGFEYVTMSVVCGFLIINLVGSIAYAQTSRIGNIVDNFPILIPTSVRMKAGVVQVRLSLS
jgi:hypothetical protein